MQGLVVNGKLIPRGSIPGPDGNGNCPVESLLVISHESISTQTDSIGFGDYVTSGMSIIYIYS